MAPAQPTRRDIGLVLVSWVITVVTVIMAIVYIDFRERQHDREWCEVLTTLVAPNGPPPVNARQYQIALALAKLYEVRRCGPELPVKSPTPAPVS